MASRLDHRFQRSFNLAACMMLTVCATAARGSQPTASAPVPHVDGPWKTLTGNPDLGPYTSDGQQPVDFAIWQAADGSWQLWSCIRGTKCSGNGRLFHRWSAEQLTDTDWQPQGIAMEADPRYGETPGGLQAPHVVRVGAQFFMLYGDWEHICLAASRDGKHFERFLSKQGQAGLFSEAQHANTRDIMAIRIGELWHGYYTAHPRSRGAVYCRTSPDLKHWGPSRIVAFGGRAGTGPNSAECPHVVARHGIYYLFRTQQYGQSARTCVYVSTDPMNFGIHDDGSFFLSELPVAAPEIIHYQGQDYIAALKPGLDGIHLAKLRWSSPNEPSRAP